MFLVQAKRAAEQDGGGGQTGPEERGGLPQVLDRPSSLDCYFVPAFGS